MSQLKGTSVLQGREDVSIMHCEVGPSSVPTIARLPFDFQQSQKRHWLLLPNRLKTDRSPMDLSADAVA